MNFEVQLLLAQLQAQYGNNNTDPSFVAYANIEYLRKELLKRGYNTNLDGDGKTVVLVPVMEQKKG